MIYVMSDIHGMYEKYEKMLKQIDFSEKDTLYVLGDIVDRGSGSMKVLQDMMRRANVHGLIGNHELMCVSCMDWLSQEITEDAIAKLSEAKLRQLEIWLHNGAAVTIREFQALSRSEQKAIMRYLLDLAAYEELHIGGKSFLLVHGGLGRFSADKPLSAYDLNELVWTRPDCSVPWTDDPDRYMVVGHTPTQLISGKAEIFWKNQYIFIDCGACMEGGVLACLCLDTMKAFYV